jgi:hypothetical protein
MKNTISVKAYIVDGSINDILEDASPKTALDEYFSPDTRPPVEELVISAFADDGRVVDIYITPKKIRVDINTVSGE